MGISRARACVNPCSLWKSHNGSGAVNAVRAVGVGGGAGTVHVITGSRKAGILAPRTLMIAKGTL